MVTQPEPMDYQQNQKKVIENIEKQVKQNSLQFSTVDPVEDFDSDPRICLTSIHIPNDFLKNKIQKQIIDPLRVILPEHYYYSADSLHMTIKNIRVINNPPHFNNQDIEKARKIFSEAIPKYSKFKVYFYRLLLFPNNLALIGTADEELDKIVLGLDRKLRQAGVPDDKIYSNPKYFFSNMTLVRFNNPLSEEFKTKVKNLSDSLSFEPYLVDSVVLLTCNAVFKKRQTIGTWGLK